MSCCLLTLACHFMTKYFVLNEIFINFIYLYTYIFICTIIIVYLFVVLIQHIYYFCYYFIIHIFYAFIFAKFRLPSIYLCRTFYFWPFLCQRRLYDLVMVFYFDNCNLHGGTFCSFSIAIPRWIYSLSYCDWPLLIQSIVLK